MSLQNNVLFLLFVQLYIPGVSFKNPNIISGHRDWYTSQETRTTSDGDAGGKELSLNIGGNAFSPDLMENKMILPPKVGN